MMPGDRQTPIVNSERPIAAPVSLSKQLRSAGYNVGMPLPVVLVKVFLAIKILKYPVAAAIDSLREYRRRERMRERRLHFVATRHFFHHPLRSLLDGRFWRKCVTNAAEIIVHLVSIWAMVWNIARRLTTDGYVSWRPHHTPEREHYRFIESEPWKVVFRRTGLWLANAFRRWPGARTTGVELRGPARRGNWVELCFDGGYVMLRGRCGSRKRSLRFQRPGSSYALITHANPNSPVTVVVRDDSGTLLRSLVL
jgi:hypothetical protein